LISLLSGVRVVDVSRLIPGAYATAKLADLGADVIKVEQPPLGDYMRAQPPLHEGVGLLYKALNRNKRSVALDLKSDDGRAAFEALVASADLFIENGRPGAAARTATDYEAIRVIKPDIVYCSITGFGQTGPYRMLPSHGANMEALAGLVDIQEREDGTAEPPNIRIFMSSQAGAMHAALGMVSALERRRRTGEGAYLDVSCWEAGVNWQYGNLTSLANLGELFAGSEGLGPRYGCYRTKDDGWVFFAAIEPKFWQRFCAAIERPDLGERVDAGQSSDFGDDNDGGALRASLAEALRSRTQAEWVELAIELQLPITPVLRPEDLHEDPHVREREVFVQVTGNNGHTPVEVLSLPIKVGGEHFEITRHEPAMGEHTGELLAELGLAEDVAPA
jgi:crotonobetainyl-CoA:carnitine CoA-transferase CaiB-like acyl-CoA transferase